MNLFLLLCVGKIKIVYIHTCFLITGGLLHKVECRLYLYAFSLLFITRNLLSPARSSQTFIIRCNIIFKTSFYRVSCTNVSETLCVMLSIYAINLKPYYRVSCSDFFYLCCVISFKPCCPVSCSSLFLSLQCYQL